jgi:hypothetical protein
MIKKVSSIIELLWVCHEVWEKSWVFYELMRNFLLRSHLSDSARQIDFLCTREVNEEENQTILSLSWPSSDQTHEPSPSSTVVPSSTFTNAFKPIKFIQIQSHLSISLRSRSLHENFIAVFPPEMRQSRKKKKRKTLKRVKLLELAIKVDEEEGDKKKFAYSRASNSLFMSVEWRKKKSIFQSRSTWMPRTMRIISDSHPLRLRNQLENYKFFSISSVDIKGNKLFRAPRLMKFIMAAASGCKRDYYWDGFIKWRGKKGSSRAFRKSKKSQKTIRHRPRVGGSDSSLFAPTSDKSRGASVRIHKLMAF